MRSSSVVTVNRMSWRAHSRILLARSHYHRRRRNLCVTLVVRGENAGKKYLECGAALIG